MLPTTEIAKKVLKYKLVSLDTSEIDWDRVAKLTNGLSHGEIGLACEHAAKNAILSISTKVLERDLEQAIEERLRTHAAA
jgi:ATP-dependent 26S proteasome regulatory subunit